MRVAIVGGGLSGRAIEQAVRGRGAATEMFSRATGFDILRDDAAQHIGHADVIVEATGHFTTSKKAATNFFSASTRAVADAARTLGATHILLSIVNCELPEVQGYGYFVGKAMQERIAREESPDLILVRSTQWFEYARQNLERMKAGPFALVPGMSIKPVALSSVADVIAECATGVRSGTSYEIAGPEVTTLWQMTTQLPDKGVIPVPLPIPGRMGRAFREGILTPGDQAEIVGPRFSEWLTHRDN